MLSTEKKDWTYEEYYKLGNEERFEVIKGELFMVPAPDLEHQKISRKLEFKMVSYVENNDLGEIFDAPVDVIFENDVVLQPDIIFISKDRSSILQKRGVFGSPDLIVEIISKSSVKIDKHEKFKLYEKFKVKEYWLIDPANKTIEIFYLAGEKYELSCFASEEEDIAESNVLKGFGIKIREVF